MKRAIVAALGGAIVCSSAAAADEYGKATYYQNPRHGGLIAAHRTLPFGTRVRVLNLDNLIVRGFDARKYPALLAGR